MNLIPNLSLKSIWWPSIHGPALYAGLLELHAEWPQAFDSLISNRNYEHIMVLIGLYSLFGRTVLQSPNAVPSINSGAPEGAQTKGS